MYGCEFIEFILVTLGKGRGSVSRAGAGTTLFFVSVSSALQRMDARDEGDSIPLSLFGSQI